MSLGSEWLNPNAKKRKVESGTVNEDAGALTFNI
jgi:hypothetical protein